jgi:tetratricopeptide (TPR) repeat protein
VSDAYDLFISHHPRHAESARRLAETLRILGVSCFAGADAPEPWSDAAPAGPAHAKALLAWCCEDYFQSRACQAQLAAAFIAQRQDASATPARILLVNAQAGVKHIYPVHLRGLLFASAPGLPEAPGFQDLAERLRAHCAELTGTLGDLCPLDPPRWRTAFSGYRKPARLFEGRERELWDIHDALLPALTDSAPAGEGHGPAVVVSGPGGQGKSRLAREYAFRFGAAFPGGLFWLTATEAAPATNAAELAENPALKMQLAALLRQLFPDADSDGLDAPTLLSRLGHALDQTGRPFLWIVDDLPNGLNGMAFRQWLAPATAGRWGRTLITSRSRRYDEKAEPIHLPPLDAGSAGRLMVREAPPDGPIEQTEAGKISDSLGRHALAVSVAGALAGMDRQNPRTRYAALRQRLSEPGKEALDTAARLSGELPKEYEASVAAALLYALESMDEAGRDLLRLAAELAEAPMSADFMADCLLRSGLCAEESRKNGPLARLAAPRESDPMDADAAHRHTEAGMAVLEQLSLGERTDGGIDIHPLAAHLMQCADPAPARRAALRRAAVYALYGMGERCAQSGHWQPLAPLAPHARRLAADLRNRPIGGRVDPSDIGRRIRLGFFLGDMDIAHGAPHRALSLYRNLGASLARTAPLSADGADWQGELSARCDRIGDLLAARGDLPGALDSFRKSLGIRKHLAARNPVRGEPQRDLVANHHKIGDVLLARGNAQGALDSYRAALALAESLAAQNPDNAGHRFDLAVGHERLAALYLRTGRDGEALNALHPALTLYENLARQNPAHVKFARAPVVIHNMIGDILRAHGDTAGALERYRAALAIAEGITAREPAHPEWQRDLALSHNNVGNVLAALGNPAGAAEHYRAYLAIAEGLAAQDLADGARQRDLAVSYMKLGMAIELAQDAPGALECYRKARTIAEKLAVLAPNSTVLRNDLAWVLERIDSLGAVDAEA